ncbi:MAG: hypothetical protein AAFZ07_13015 [Actinomycetota bacterium]
MRRIVTWGLVVAGTVALVVLGFSDRAPDVVESIAHPAEDALAGVVHALGFEAPGWWHVLRDSPDVVFHALQWAGLTGGLVLAFGGRVRVRFLALGAFATSLAVEVLQMSLSATRRYELGDLFGNAVGVLVGAVAGLVVLAVVDRWQRRHPAAV